MVDGLGYAKTKSGRLTGPGYGTVSQEQMWGMSYSRAEVDGIMARWREDIAQWRRDRFRRVAVSVAFVVGWIVFHWWLARLV